MQKPTLTGLIPEEISALLPPGKERYRGMQIFRWIHNTGAEQFDEMTNLARTFRSEIEDMFHIGAVEPADHRVSEDGTEKYLWRLVDGHTVESVIIHDTPRITACISSQVGCKFGCAFCRTGTMGFLRNLTAGEIIDQLIRMRKSLTARGNDISNVVFMGMGEPLDNFDAIIRAIDIFTRETGLAFGKRKITVSTCGVVPQIRQLAQAFPKVGLAVSLNATTDAVRDRIMPVNRTWPLRELLDSTRDFAHDTGRRVTFEYILMKGINDSAAQAHELMKLLRPIPSKINLIAFNEHPDSPIRRPSDTTIDTFQKILLDNHLTAMLRKSKGTDILAACGQLASAHTP